MRLILLGPPGSGKGTQAQLLSARNGLEHIATGDILREAKARKTAAGLRAAPFMDAGQLVPDDLVNDVIAECFDRPKRPTRFVMDGYPRTLGQAAAFEQTLARHALALTAVVLIRASDEEIIRRITGRMTCPVCKTPYHVETNPPRVPGVCDREGAPLVQRADDRLDTVKARLEVYRKETTDLVPYYRERCLLREVCGEGDIEEVYRKVIEALRPEAGLSC